MDQTAVYGGISWERAGIYSVMSQQNWQAQRKKLHFRWGEETYFLALIQRVKSCIAKEIPIVLAQHVRVLYWMAFSLLSISFSFKNCRI